jgi:hypothetical protein
MTNKHDEKDGGKESKTGGLKKLSAAQLAALLKAVSDEIEARAQDEADKKPLSTMNRKEFETFVAKAIAQGDKE